MTVDDPPRWVGVVMLVVLAWPIYGCLYGSWQEYWLLKDGQPGTATVTRAPASGHGQVLYNYKVNHRVYRGRDRIPGDQGADNARRFPFASTVYFSASHPWISRLQMPKSFVGGWGLLTILFPFVVVALFLTLRPKPKARTIVIPIGPSSEITEDNILDAIFRPDVKGKLE